MSAPPENAEEISRDDSTLTPEQAAELDRRLAEFEKDPCNGVPWDQVKAEMRECFGWE